MKWSINFFYAIAGVLLIISTACQKEVPLTNDGMYWGEAYAKYNDEIEWSAVSMSWKAGFGEGEKAAIAFDVLSSQGFRRETLQFQNIPLATGKVYLHHADLVYEGKPCVSYHTLEDDGDAGGDSYQLLEENADNYLVITSYDERTKEIKGTFEVALTITMNEWDTKANPNAPDTIRFTQGAFHAMVKPLVE